MKTFRRPHRKLQRGQAIVIIALAFIGIMAFAVLAIDGGRYYDQRRVAQNASDMSAMAGLHKRTSAADPDTIQESAIITEINRIAELNYIPDSDATAANAVNTNVTAWWVNNIGEAATGDWGTSEITNSNEVAPGATMGVKVRAKITYRTFMGGIIGQSVLTVQGDSIAKLTVRFRPPVPGDIEGPIYTGGSDCDNLSNKIAHHYRNTNTAKFMGKVYIDGSLVVGSVTATDFYGDFEVRADAGEGTPPTIVDIGADNPLDAPNNKWHGNSYIPPDSPAKPSKGMPDFFHRGGNSANPLIDHEDFRPGTGAYYKLWERVYPVGSPGNMGIDKRWHYFAGNKVSGHEADNPETVTGQAVLNAYNIDGKLGVYFVDGDLFLPDRVNWKDVPITLIVNGRFQVHGTGTEIGTAGPMVSNMSVLAGGDLGTLGNDYAERCASDNDTWVFRARGNNTQFFGVVYVPYGQIWFDGNTSGGGDFSEAMIVHSMYLDGNSWQFNFDPSALVMPELSGGLSS